MKSLEHVNKKILIGSLGVVALVLVLFVATLFRAFIGSRVLPPNLSEEHKRTIEGSFSSNNLSPGTHTLTFTATLSDGRQATDTRSFEILPPYGSTPIPPSPYGSETPVPQPTMLPY